MFVASSSQGLNIPVVHRPDRRDLLTFLESETATSANIDKSAPLERPTQLKRVAEHDTDHHPLKKPRFEDGDVQRMRQQMAARLDGPKEQSVTLENITYVSRPCSQNNMD
jgi:parafibromin